ncbi:MAG: sugar transferase [Rariglobus sp.]|jgi:NDP-sugar pyrophosphorylase family protein|nr:sugar transferase [Rariglobus sp.]
MKTLLICPAHRPAVARLAKACPLVLVPILGKCLVEYWLEYLVLRGDHEVRIIAIDRAEQVRALVGDGSRWGMRVEVIAEVNESDPVEIRAHRDGHPVSPATPPAPDDVVLMDHLPGLSGFPLFDSYEAWFHALQAWIPQACTPDRIGRREISPGIFVGLHSRISPAAQLNAPCWIGDNVFVGPDAVIGPGAILEDRAFIECGAHITRSVVGPETFVGELTLIDQSLASGNLLINWKNRSCLDVPDEFLLCSLGVRQPPPRARSWVRSPLMSLRELIPSQQE